MATTEHTINDALAEILRKTRSVWRSSNVVTSENTSMLKGSSARPDIIVAESSVSPVVIETEVLPATTVEKEAIDRLGEQLRDTGRTILSSLAVRLPERLRQKQGAALKSELKNARDLEVALFTGSHPSSFSRWPQSGWLEMGIADLSILVQSASIPPDVIDMAAQHLVDGVIEAAGLLDEMAQTNPGAIQRISEHLHQEDDTQTRRMAATILANAFMFHESLTGGPDELANVKSLDELRNSTGNLSKAEALAEWRKILTVDYWPIFDIARRILEAIPTPFSRLFIEGLAATAEKLLQNRLMRSHDLTGAVFQRLIADRKFLAAFYTTPASAALLIGLAITPDSLPNGGSWASADDVKALRIADFACGTGTLLSTAYQRISQLHEMAGGDIEAIHADMMASAIVGCDVLPAAAHLTASMLAGSHPTVKYEQSSILTLAYGIQPDGAVALGSLDLLNPQGTLPTLEITAKAAEGLGEAEKNIWRSLPHASFDVIIMNPPFTRATGHESKYDGIPNPMFAAFSSSAEEQRLMGRATKRLTDGTSAHGNAGEASIFLVLADRKLTSGGTLALVMPLTLLSGSSWEASRALLSREYSNLILVTIAGVGGAEMSFSADTGMGECLVIGRRSKSDNKRATFVTLNVPPAYPLLGATAAAQIHRLVADDSLQSLEDGPTGGSPIKFGAEIIGQALDAPLPESGGWNLTRIADFSLAQVAYQLASENRIWLPTQPASDTLVAPITTIEAIGLIGPHHRDVSQKSSDGSIRGPFEVFDIQHDTVPTYPILWAHDANRREQLHLRLIKKGFHSMFRYQMNRPT